jgi:hypothetical protein
MGGYIDDRLVIAKGTASIKHNDTGEIYTIDSEDLDWNVINSSEEYSHLITYEAVFCHEHLGDLTWQYGWCAQEPNIGDHELIKNFTDFEEIGIDKRNEESE